MYPGNNPNYEAFTFALILGNIAPTDTKAFGFLKAAESFAAGLTKEEIEKGLVQARMEVESWED